MKTRHIISLAALTLVMGSCTNDETSQQPKVSSGIPFTATISAGSMTRALTENTTDKTLDASWVEEEQVALIHNDVVDVMKVEAIDNDTKSATISGTITGSPADGDAVTIVYPASAVDKETKAVKSQLLDKQDGLLETISSKLDLRQSQNAKLKLTGTVATLDGFVKVTNQLAVVKFSLSDGNAPICPKKFVIKNGSGSVLTTVEPSTDISDLYIAMSPASNAAFSFEATVGENVYTYSKEGVTLEAGKYYQSPLAMSLPVPEKQDGSIAFATAAPSQTWSATASNNTYTQTVTHTGDGTVTYSISDNTCGAEIDESSGKVTFTKAGSVTVTATVDDTNAYTYATKNVSYTLTINKAAGSISYTTGTVEKLTTNGAFTNALTKVGDGKVIYSSSDTDGTIATVNSSTGEVTIKGSGEAIITATVEDSDTYTYATKTATYTVKVSVPTQTIGGAVGYGEGGDLTPMTPAN